MCLHVFAFVEPGSKNVKSDISYVSWYDLLIVGFFIGAFYLFVRPCRIYKLLESLVLFILDLLFDYKLYGLVKWYQQAISPANKINDGRTSKLNLVQILCFKDFYL